MLGWPVSGTVVSGFGMRWGRMHEGIDISRRHEHARPCVGRGGTVSTPAGSAGTATSSSSTTAAGLSTAYAHNTSFAVG